MHKVMTPISIDWTLGLAWMAGLSIPVGALISSHLVLRKVCRQNELDSFVSYFGGGALLAAIVLVLIPDGIEHTSVLSMAVAFGLGGLVFWQFSAWAERTHNSASIFVGMLLDFFPEALLVGVLAVSGSDMVYLMVGLIALQNMPEGFAAYHEMEHSMRTPSRLFMIFCAVSIIGPLAAWMGYVWFSSSEFLLSIILLFCSGGILYLIFEDIAPESRSKYSSFPAVGSILGFLLGLIGTKIIH